MAASPSLEEAREAIRSMAVRGATRISVLAAEALAVEGQRLAPSGWQDHFRAAARRLASARPTAVSLENGLAAVAAPALACSTARAAGLEARRAADQWSQRLQAGQATIAGAAAAELPPRATVLTHCHSATVQAVFRQARLGDRLASVVATETRPWRQGLVTVRQLSEAGIPCKLVVDSAANHLLHEGGIDAVLVGADTVCLDGTLINKIGTSAVALAAHDAKVPVYCATSFCKFTHRAPQDIAIEERPPEEIVAAADLPRGVGILNPVFDRTRPELVTRFVTEHGALAPTHATRTALRDIPEALPW